MKLYTSKNMTILTNKHFKNKKLSHPLFKGKAGMFLVSADWCPHCIMLKDTWIKFKKLSGKDFPVAVLDSQKYPEIIRSLGVHGYPTIFVVKSNGDLKEYTKSRSILDLGMEMCSLMKSHPRCNK